MVSGRSPAYPYIDLSKAVDTIKKIHSLTKGHSTDTESLFKQLGYNGMTGTAKKTLAALKYFGLLDQPHGSKKSTLTERSLQIIHGVKDSQEQMSAIKNAFLAPSIYSYCWETWNGDDIADEIMKSNLILQKGFNDSTVMGFITNYKQSMQFAKIEQNGSADNRNETTQQSNFDEPENFEPENEVDRVTPEVNVGDVIQWNSNGVDQLNPVRKVRSLHDSGEWLFIEGSETGIPIEEVTVVERTNNNQTRTPPTLNLPTQELIQTRVDDEEVFMANYLSKQGNNPVSFRLLVKGDLGVNEIGKLIKLLEAQKLILED